MHQQKQTIQLEVALAVVKGHDSNVRVNGQEWTDKHYLGGNIGKLEEGRRLLALARDVVAEHSPNDHDQTRRWHARENEKSSR